MGQPIADEGEPLQHQRHAQQQRAERNRRAHHQQVANEGKLQVLLDRLDYALHLSPEH